MWKEICFTWSRHSAKMKLLWDQKLSRAPSENSYLIFLSSGRYSPTLRCSLYQTTAKISNNSKILCRDNKKRKFHCGETMKNHT